MPTDNYRPVSGSARLSGWKEIASFCGKGVRTVQRWEALGLPIHRVHSSKGDTVFAIPAEVEAWMVTAGAPDVGDGGAESVGEREVTTDERPAEPKTASPAAPDRRWLLPVLSIGTAALIVAVGAFGVPALRPRHGEPSQFVADVDSVHAFDSNGKDLWTYKTDHPLDVPAYKRDGDNGVPLYLVQDIDGDGHRETLFIETSPPTAAWEETPLVCLAFDGAYRFSWNRRVPVTFGSQTYPPPFRVKAMVAGRRNGHPVVWVAAHQIPDFPTVVVPLDLKSGVPEGEFWNPGYILDMRLGRFFGRDVLVAGGCNNEGNEAALLLIDVEAASGSTPADTSKFRCANCSHVPPLAEVRFPSPDLSRETGSGVPCVTRLSINDAGNILAQVKFPVAGHAGEEMSGSVMGYYTLDRELRVVHAELGAEYERRHKWAEGAGLIHHPYAHEDEAQLLPIRVRMSGGPWVLRQLETSEK